MLTTRPYRVGLALFAIAFSLALHTPAGFAQGQGQGQGRRPLFGAPGAAHADRADRAGHRPQPRRSRVATLQLESLAPADGATGEPAVDLNLFDDVAFVARIQHFEQRGPGSFLWHGRLDGVPTGHATFVSTNGVVAGTVFGDGVTYEVSYEGGNDYEVRELDPAAFPTDDPPSQLDLSPGVVADVASAPVAADSAAQIDVMVVWTPAAETAAGGLNAMRSLVDLSVANTNTAYANSGISTRVRLVYKGQVAYTESTSISTDLSRLMSPSDTYIDSVHALRTQYGADIVSLLGTTYISSSGACGIGYLMGYVSTGFSSSAFNVVDQACAAGNLSYAHEVGHNQGMHHDQANAGGAGAYAYSYGYIDPSCAFRTVMAYGGCTRVTQFSNPNASYGGRVTGTATANNALTLNNTAATIANFKAAVTGACTYSLASSSWAAPVGRGIVERRPDGERVGMFVDGLEQRARVAHAHLERERHVEHDRHVLGRRQYRREPDRDPDDRREHVHGDAGRGPVHLHAGSVVLDGAGHRRDRRRSA